MTYPASGLQLGSAAPRSGPQNLEAERALLGGMLLDNRKIPEILELVPMQARRAVQIARTGRPGGPVVEEPLFSHFANQEIFETVLALYDRDRAVDLTTLGEELSKLGRYEAVGGAPYLASLEEELISTLYLPEYARIVVEKWRLRSLLRAAEAIADDVRRSQDEPEKIIDRSEQRLFEIAQQAQSRDFVHVGEVAAEVMAEIEARQRNDTGELAGLPTGFRELDRMTTGLRPSNLVILAARPSVGKSAFAMNIAVHNALHGRPVGVFSLEMSAAELNHRLMCTLARVPMSKMRSNRVSRQEMDELHSVAIRLGTAPLFIDDSSSLSVMELRARARRLKSRVKELSLIIVDYLQLMSGPVSRSDNRQQEVSAISRALKGLARDLEVPVIALSQLSRESEKRGGRNVHDRMPKLSDLRESGAIEQDADLVVFIHRDIVKDKERAPGEPDLAMVRIGKQRNGPTGDIEMLFRGEFTQFVDIHPEARGHGGKG